MAKELTASTTLVDWGVPMVLAVCALTAIGAGGRMALGPRQDPPRADAAAPLILVGAVVVGCTTALIAALV